ncbi:MAG: YHS domain-containing (seleno)protein [Hyphomicrobiales bacterium]
MSTRPRFDSEFRPTRRALLGSAIALATAAAVSPLVTGPAFAKKPSIYTGIVRGTAVGGYDPVAYFKAGRAVKGSKNFSTKYRGVNWRFSSAENLAAFKASPRRYAPAFGGYCAWAVSQGYTAKGDPRHWNIVGGKLYLNYSRGVKAKWSKDKSGNIRKGNANWPGVLN